jgi:hypothetical protein
MSEQNEHAPDDLVAFKLVQHFTMQGEASYEDFMQRVSALKLIAQKLDLLRQAEVKLAEQEKYIEQLEGEVEVLRSLSPTSEEVLQDLDSTTQ